jgi:transposase-like protein
LNTKKIGFRSRVRATSQGEKNEQIQRWLCKDCLHSFSSHQQNDTTIQRSLIYKAIELYFDSEASYRAVGRQLGIKPLKVFEFVNDLGAACKSFVEVATELQPQWSGYLLLDGKTIPVKKERYALLLAADAATHDIPCALFSKGEDYQSYRTLLNIFKEDLRYPIKGLVIDGDPGLIRAVREVFPGIPWQLCVKHLDSYHNYYFRYQYQGSGIGVAEFLEISHKLLYATKPEHLDHLYRHYLEFLEEFEGKIDFQKILETFGSKFGNIWVHLETPGLPRTTNIIEGIIRQLSRKLDDTDGFNYPETAWNSIKLLIMRYRFKKFTCSRIKGHNGHSPLSLAGVNVKHINWVRFSQKRKH